MFFLPVHLINKNFVLLSKKLRKSTSVFSTASFYLWPLYFGIQPHLCHAIWDWLIVQRYLVSFRFSVFTFPHCSICFYFCHCAIYWLDLCFSGVFFYPCSSPCFSSFLFVFVIMWDSLYVGSMHLLFFFFTILLSALCVTLYMIICVYLFHFLSPSAMFFLVSFISEHFYCI